MRSIAARLRLTRERIERALRKAAVPAGVGITLALAGCVGQVTESLPLRYAYPFGLTRS